MEFNQDKVRKITSEILTAAERLEELKGLSKDDFFKDPHKIASSKYHLIVAIEGAIDLCNHIISKNGFRTPEDYADTFKVMYENGAFKEDFTYTLFKMARFRNRLVHLYREIDNNELYTIIQSHIIDIRNFLKAFGVYLSQNP